MHTNRLSYLDYIRLSGGADRLKNLFGEIVRRDRREALRYICDDGLQFPTFYILIPDIFTFRLTGELDSKKTEALHICGKKIKLLGADVEPSYSEVQDGETLHKALRWMFSTGKSWDGLSKERDGFDSVMDYAAALLILDFEDTEVLPDVAELIFSRNRMGLLIHDLAWCFFQAIRCDALKKIAGYLLSSNPQDRELACKLLHLGFGAVPGGTEAKELYDYYIGWLDDNTPYLYLTGEHFQMTSKPTHISCDPEAKYLGKEISPRHRAPVEPLTEIETICLRAYREAPENEQRLLTDYSHKLRRRDARLWDEWMQKQVAQQVIAARNGYEAV